MQILFLDGRRHLTNRRQIVEDPERPAIGADDQIVILHDQIGHCTVGRLSFRWRQVLPASVENMTPTLVPR